MLRYLLSILFVSLSLYGASLPSLDTLLRMPTGVEKDYFIWRYLQSDKIDAAQARGLIRYVSHINGKLRSAYRRKTGENPPAVKNPYGATPPHIWKRRLRAHKYFQKGLKLMRLHKEAEAAAYFDAARKNYRRREEVDKTLFWLYLATKKRYYLDVLRKSPIPDFYTLLAADTVNAKYPPTPTFTFKADDTPHFNPSDPVDWAWLKATVIHTKDRDKLKHLANRYASKECLGVCTYILGRADSNKRAYYPMPYRKIMRRLPIERQALIYAIARQESRFVPSAISRSFALGLMQFMPFLIDHIAKERGERIRYEDIFNPAVAIAYANTHLNYLERFLYHPLFIAYAYNAGIGFTKRYLLNPKHFRPGAYEPYMSMETMPNAQAREYGKKVLTNYVIYLNKLGKPTRMIPLVKVLASPEKTDAFRH